MMFSYYSGNILESKSIGLLGVDKFIDAHKNPKTKTRILIEKIKLASELGFQDEKSRLKKQLFSFTPRVLVPIGKKRLYDNIKEFTGLMQLDFDKFDSESLARDFKTYLFDNYEETLCCYMSPSRLGVKALMRIKTPSTIEQYKAIHYAVSKEFDNVPQFDKATKNPILPLFISYDEDILYREIDNCSLWTDENWSEQQALKEQEFDVEQSSGTKLELKVINSTKQHIREIVDNGHPQVRRAGLILGSRISAGYISRHVAEGLIRDLIRENTYLSKGTRGYILTAEWGIKQGLKNPRYYDDDRN